jgi:hypothetical protein
MAKTREKRDEQSQSPEELVAKMRLAVHAIRESYWALGEMLNTAHSERVHRKLGFKTFKDFVEQECDVINGPSAQILRKVNKFFSEDMKETLRERPEDYERLLDSCKKVSSQKLMELSKRKDFIDDADKVENVLDDLEHLPTRQFKERLNSRSAEKEGRFYGSDVGSHGSSDTIMEAKVVKRTYKISKDIVDVVDAAFEKARVEIAEQNSGSAGQELAVICKAYQNTEQAPSVRAGATHFNAQLSLEDEEKIEMMLSRIQDNFCNFDVRLVAVCGKTSRIIFGAETLAQMPVTLSVAGTNDLQE